MFKFLSNLFDSNEKQLKSIQPIIDEINSYEKNLSKLTDDELKEKSLSFRKTIGYNKETSRTDFEKLDDSELEVTLKTEREKLLEILPEAYAVIREASNRVTKHRHFDVQVSAGYFLFQSKVIELFTGEGKTLAANMPMYLYGLTGRGSHLVTVNDYLARRDAEWNGHIFNALGLTVAAVNSGTQYKYITDKEALKLKGAEAKKLIKERDANAKEIGRLRYDHMSGVNLIECTKKEAYDCDLVYGTNNEFGFDYLRDNMAPNLSDRVQGPLYFTIVDEADSILIDEARTPLIISTSASASNDMYKQFANISQSLKPEKDYVVDEKARAVSLTNEGIDRVEKELGVDNIYEDGQIAYHLDNALKAKELYTLDDAYLVRDGEVMIVDEFTGRVLGGRRYSEGLHQAIEAKEGVEVKRESRTMATITLQNYFRLYKYMSGMTATALTEAEEFANIYNLDTVVVPTNKPVVRKDNADIVFRTTAGKYRAIVADITEKSEKGQPVLVGTTSVEKSEIISDQLKKEGVKHSVLNAKHHEREAEIVAEAGQPGQVTIATNMAGRGTDISLGDGVKELGGLYVIGSERHEARRIDNQLRGRSGRQGDPGETTFYISFDDDLMRLFGGDNLANIMGNVGMDDDMPVSMGILGKSIETAQKRVESHHYDTRKNLVEYDDVLNQQREIIYSLRRKLLNTVSNIEVDKDEKEVKVDSKAIKNLDINLLTEELDRFTLSEKSTWNVDQLKGFKSASLPVSLWVLKKIIGNVRYIVAAQLQDDMAIDDKEERQTVAHIRGILSDSLLGISVKLLGYGNDIGFFRDFDKESDLAKKEDMLLKLVTAAFIFHTSAVGGEGLISLIKLLVLQSIDNFWMEHLDSMADLREGISLRNLAQKNPLVEYKNEGFALFDKMLLNIDESVVNRFFKVRVVQNQQQSQAQAEHEAAGKIGSQDKRPGAVAKQVTVKKSTQKIGRNDPCPCGSGKKYKKCGLKSTPEHKAKMANLKG